MTPEQLARLERIQTVDDVLHIGEDYGWSAPVTRAAIERYAAGEVDAERQRLADAVDALSDGISDGHEWDEGYAEGVGDALIEVCKARKWTTAPKGR